MSLVYKRIMSWAVWTGGMITATNNSFNAHTVCEYCVKRKNLNPLMYKIKKDPFSTSDTFNSSWNKQINMPHCMELTRTSLSFVILLPFEFQPGSISHKPLRYSSLCRTSNYMICAPKSLSLAEENRMIMYHWTALYPQRNKNKGHRKEKVTNIHTTKSLKKRS